MKLYIKSLILLNFIFYLTSSAEANSDLDLSRAVFGKVSEIVSIQQQILKTLKQKFSSSQVRERNKNDQCKALIDFGSLFFQEDTKVAELETLHGNLSPVLEPIKQQIKASRDGYVRLIDFCDSNSFYFKNIQILDGRLRSLAIDVRRVIDRLADVESVWPGFDLTNEQREALLKAVQSGGFIVSILSRWNEDWDHRENLVILGEAHIKNKHIDEIGFNATQGYAHLGVEGANWASPEFSQKLNRYYNSLKKIMCGSLQETNQVDATDSSTIHKASKAYFKLDPHSITALEKDFILSSEEELLLKKFEAQLDEKLSSYEEVVNFQKTFLGQAFVNIIVNFMKMSLKNGEEQLKSGLLDSIELIQKHRNEVMAEAASKLPRTEKNATALVVVGADHVEAISKILVDRFQFSKVTVDQISSWTSDSLEITNIIEQFCD